MDDIFQFVFAMDYIKELKMVYLNNFHATLFLAYTIGPV